MPVAPPPTARAEPRRPRIVNLVDRAIELYSRPMPRKGVYADTSHFRVHQTLVLQTRTARPLRVPARLLMA